MPLDINTIYTKFIEVIDSLVGDDLARVSDGTNNGSLPAIYRKADPNPKGRYPFITVGVDGISQQSNRSLLEYYNSDGNLVTASNWDMRVVIGVFSTDHATNTAENIAFKLSSLLTTRNALCMFSDVGEVADVLSISLSNFKRDNEVGEAAVFNVLFSTYVEEVNDEYEMTEVLADVNLRYDGDDENVASTTLHVIKSED